MEGKDVAPELLERVQREFTDHLGGNERAKQLLATIESGAAGYADAAEYAKEVGEALAGAFGAVLSESALPDGRMYWNIAERVIRPMLEEDHRLVAAAAERVQEALNEAAGIGIKAQAVPLNESRVEGILNRVCGEEEFEKAAWILDEPVVNYSMSVVDESIRRNVEFQGKAGLRPKIVRRAEAHCCAWCSKLDGSYTYPDVPQDIYRRHEHCRCTVEYDPGDGKRQDVWSKEWTEPEDSAILEQRKTVGLEDAARDDDPRTAAVKSAMTEQVRQLPEELQESLRENTGFSGTRINSAIGQNRVTETLQKQIGMLDKALENGVMPQETVLFRRTSSEFLGLPKNPTVDILSEFNDRIITNDIFTSTSFRDLELPGRNTLLELTVPEGYKGCQYMEPVAFPKYKNQDEILFARGLQYKMSEIQYENGQYRIKAEVQQ